MARLPVTQAEIDKILATKKRVAENLRWIVNPKESWAKCSLRVIDYPGVSLRLAANVNMELPEKFSFSLILNSAYRIAALDVSGSHRNKHTNREEWLARTHMMRWTDVCRDTFAYTPQIDPGKDIESAFRFFLMACNIDFTGQVGTSACLASRSPLKKE